MKTNVKKYVSLVMTSALVLGSAYNVCTYAKAAGKVSLTKTAKVEVGKSSVLKLKNSAGKVVWKVTKGKNVVKIIKKKKGSCTIKGIKKGNAVVQAVVKKKKLSCKVTVTTKKVTTTTEKPVTTPESTVAPTETSEPTVAPTETPKPTVAPTETPKPIQTLEPTVKPDDKNEPEIPDGVRIVEYDGTNRDEIQNINEPFYLNIKEGVTYIGADMTTGGELIMSVLFSNENVVGVSIPKSAKEISIAAFTGCTNLKSVYIAGNITEIGYRAFAGCKSLRKIKIPQSVKNIDSYAFEGCESLTDITIPEGITKLSEGLFRGCTGLKNINIPESVTTIDALVFDHCKGMESIYIPKNVKNINIDYTDEDDNGNENSYIIGVFYGCDKLKSIKVDVTNPYYDSRNDCNAIINKKDDILIAGCMDSVVVDGIKEIGDCAFDGCAGLTAIELPESVKLVGQYAFDDCIALKEIRVHSETNIYDNAFNGCTNLNNNIIYV